MSFNATIPRYANGRFYTAPSGRSPDSIPTRMTSGPPPIMITATTGWTDFWHQINNSLLQRGYSDASRTLYRTVMRNFYRYARQSPGRVNAQLIEDYITQLAETHCTWHWAGMTISVLRTVFDKLCGQSVTHRLITPRRSFPLPEILNRREILDLLAAATTPRDQLLLGLLYGCGLKPGELIRLTWADIDPERHILRVVTTATARELDLPPDLLPILAYGKAHCPTGDYVFQGRYEGTPLSLRMVELTVRHARQAAGVLKPITAMSLRHAYAVHCLDAGASIRDVQGALGHLDIRTTMRYQRCMLPENFESPIDTLRRRQREAAPPSPEPPAETDPTPPHHGLFAEPPSVEAVDLPFRELGDNWAAGFYRLLKTQIIGRFLGLRRFSRRGS